MAKTKTGDIKDLKFDDKNFNKGSERGMELLDKSITDFGAGRSILVDSDNNIIAGNKTAEKWTASGSKKIVVVETDGTELVVVKRTDVLLDSPKGREMALADNMVSKANFVLAEEVLAETLDAVVIEAWDASPKNDKNKEIEADDLTSKMMMKLQFSEREYRFVKQKLEETNEVHEDALLELLGYNG
jgi:hypothetical protein